MAKYKYLSGDFKGETVDLPLLTKHQMRLLQVEPIEGGETQKEEPKEQKKSVEDVIETQSVQIPVLEDETDESTEDVAEESKKRGRKPKN